MTDFLGSAFNGGGVTIWRLFMPMCALCTSHERITVLRELCCFLINYTGFTMT